MSSLRLIVLVLIVSLTSAATAHEELPAPDPPDGVDLCADVNLDGWKLQGVFPLTLVSPTVSCANGDDFVNVSKPVHAHYLREKLVYVVRVRDANTATKANHNRVQYHAVFTKKGSKGDVYDGNLYAGDLDYGGWSTFELKAVDPPKAQKVEKQEKKKHHHHHEKKKEQEKDYFQLQVRVIGKNAGVNAQHRVYDAHILVYQKKPGDEQGKPSTKGPSTKDPSTKDPSTKDPNSKDPTLDKTT